MRFYNDLAQIQTAKGVKFQEMQDTASEGDYGCDYRSITTVHTKNNQNIYLVIEEAVVSTKDRYEGITAFIIEGVSLKKLNAFKTKTKSLNSIGYGFDAFAHGQGTFVSEIHFSNDSRKLYVPIVKGETLTDNFLVYIFDGDNYVFDKNAK